MQNAEFSFNVDAHGSVISDFCFFMDRLGFTWLNQTQQLQTNSPMTWQQPASPRFNVQYKVETHCQISECTLPSCALVCVYLATAFMSWLCWVRGSLKSWEGIAYQWPESAGRLSGFLKRKVPWSYSARCRPMSRCYEILNPGIRCVMRYCVVCFLYFLLLRFLFLQGRPSLWISLQCDINNGIKVLKLCCTKEQTEGSYVHEFVGVNLNKWYTVVWCNVKQFGSGVPTGCKRGSVIF